MIVYFFLVCMLQENNSLAMLNSGWNGDNEALQAYQLHLFHPHNFYCKADFDLPYCYFNSPF